MDANIEHKGIVENIETEWVDVVMTVEGTCVSCKARGVCGADNGSEKRITIHTTDAPLYEIGEEVVVSIERNMGMKAVVIAYICPFLLMLISLLALIELGVSELVAGLTALSLTALYFFGVYLLRHKIERGIVFKLRKKE